MWQLSHKFRIFQCVVQSPQARACRATPGELYMPQHAIQSLSKDITLPSDILSPVEPPFVGVPVWPNILNVFKSASVFRNKLDL